MPITFSSLAPFDPLARITLIVIPLSSTITFVQRSPPPPNLISSVHAHTDFPFIRPYFNHRFTLTSGNLRVIGILTEREDSLQRFFLHVSCSLAFPGEGIERISTKRISAPREEFSWPKKKDEKEEGLTLRRSCSTGYSRDPTRGKDECLTRRTAVDRNDPEPRIREGLTL